MRDIEFRGKTVKGSWVYGSLVTTTSFIKHKPKQHTKTWIVETSFGNGGWFSIMKRSYVKPETVGQYTGLKDKNGVKIFEGDIVRSKNSYEYGISINREEQINKVVAFYANGFEALSQTSEDESGAYEFGLHLAYSDTLDYLDVEVIGNIFDNPELLEEKK